MQNTRRTIYCDTMGRLVQHVSTGTNNEKPSSYRWGQMPTDDPVKRQGEHTSSALYAWGMSRKLLTCPGHRELRVWVIEFKARPETQFTNR